MQLSSRIIHKSLIRWGERLRGNGLAKKFAGTEPPLRSELFSSDQMKQHGKALAESHTLALGRAPDQLLTRLAENEGVLIGACNLLTDGGQVEPPDCAGRGMAARQLLSDRRTDSHGQATLAQGLQPGTAALAERPVGRASARV